MAPPSCNGKTTARHAISGIYGALNRRHFNVTDVAVIAGRSLHAALVLLVACAGPSSTPEDAAPVDVDVDVAVDGAVRWESGTYRQTCDGSGVVALDETHFLDVNDEDQIARVYVRGADGAPIQTFDLNAGLGVIDDEADLEELARVGNRIYVIASHGRKVSGNLDRARYRFAAFDLAGSAPHFTLTPVGSTGLLLDQMLVSANWDTPNSAIISALTTASKLTSAIEPTLAAEAMGTNIEGMASDGAGHLLIGFRNPRPGGAIVVALANPDATARGQTAHFAWGRTIDVGTGKGIRSLAWGTTSAWLIAGPVADAGSFSLYQWDTVNAPVLKQALAPTSGSPEAVVTYPGSSQLQIVLDMGDSYLGGISCKDAAPGSRLFRDVIVDP